MRFDVITLFPEMVGAAARVGVTGKAIENGTVELHFWNPRDYSEDKHRTADDRPYGGGPGMVMKYQSLRDAINGAKTACAGPSKVIYLSPQGGLLTQQIINQFARHDRLVLVAGRYEGVDERVVEAHIDEEWSLGDYVLSGGELAALVVIDAVSRLLPGVLGDAESAQQDSHMQGLLDCPHYTRPARIDGMSVPGVLQGGNHAEIERWRMKQALGRTWQRRPDLLAVLRLDEEQEKLLEEFKCDEELKGQ
ncbi:MAG: tRNA (guanosine(37)-N1)-methyltransferase TrmD [Pseudomonadota bacterium]